MALRLGGLVVRGEILNTKNYSVHGWLELKDSKQPLMLELTGNCDPDLAGWHFRFETRSASDQPGQQARASANEDSFDLSTFARQQIGPTGAMTAARRVKVADCSADEVKMDEPPLEKRCLYLEWFSQNGHVVIELVDPIMEFVERIDLADGSTIVSTVTEEPEEEAELLDENDEGELEFDEAVFGDDEANEEVDEESDDPYGLFSEGLQQEFDAQASELDQTLQSEEDKPRDLQELELMDDLIENGEGELLSSIFDNPVRLPRPDQLKDDELEVALKSLLAELALFGISIHVCKHFTPRDTYRLLLDEICPEERAYPELRHTQWVQFFSTSDFCAKCEAEFEREHEEGKRRGEEDPPDEDVPF